MGKSSYFIFPLLASLMLGGCSHGLSESRKDSIVSKGDVTSIESDDKKKEDFESDSFEVSYYHNTAVMNSLEGVMILRKKSSFDQKIVRISVGYGDDDSLLEGYDSLAEFTDFKADEFEYDFRKNALIPTLCTKIFVVGYQADGSVLTKASFDVSQYKKEENLLYEFQVISDQQISVSSPCFYRRSKKAFEDIKENSPKSKMIVVNGDVVDEAKAENYDSFYDSYDKVFPNGEIPLQVGLGNHEFILQNEDGYYTGVSEKELESRYQKRLDLWKEKTGNSSPYYSLQLEGSTLIFLGTTKMPALLGGNTRADCTLGKEELAWFEKEVEKGKKSKKPIYVFSHGSLRDTVDGSLSSQNQTWYGYREDEEKEIRRIISDADDLMFFSSHSHWSFENGNSYLIQNQGPSFYNTAAVGYLWEGSGQGHSYHNGSYEYGGGQGLYVEVYEDQIFVKGRQFEAADGKSQYWYSNYQVVLPLSGKESV